MKRKEYREILACDRARVDDVGHIKGYIINKGYRVVVHFRRCQYFKSKKSLFLFYLLERMRYSGICSKYGCDIPISINVGPGFKINHPVGIIINGSAIIGKNFTIKGGAVIGKNHNGAPVIGDNVEIGVHALVIGKVVLGNNSQVGAGAIVTHDVPENGVAVCDAAHLLKIRE